MEKNEKTKLLNDHRAEGETDPRSNNKNVSESLLHLIDHLTFIGSSVSLHRTKIQMFLSLYTTSLTLFSMIFDA